MATLTNANAAFVLDEAVSTFAFGEFVESAPMMPALFEQRGSSKASESQASTAALTDFSERTELQEPTEDNPVEQYKKTITHKEFDKQCKVERKVIDDSLFPFFQDFGSKLGQSAVRTYETLAAKVFNEAFASSEYLTEDGLTLCNGAHVNADSGNSQSNSGTTALSAASMTSTRTAMMDYTDYRGQKIMVNPDLLIVPPALEQTAWEQVQSASTSAANTANFHQGQYGVVVWKYLTDANNWFMADSRAMRSPTGLVWYWRQVLEIFGDGSLMKGTRSIAGYFRTGHSAIDWRWVYGHNVA